MHLGESTTAKSSKPKNTANHSLKNKVSAKSVQSAALSHGTFSPANAAQLQRTIGNRAVLNLVSKGPGVIQRVKKENLVQVDGSAFNSMVEWVNSKPKLKKVLNMEQALLHAPNLNVLKEMITNIKKEVEFPSIGFSEDKFYQKTVADYFTKYPEPVEGAKPSWSMMTAGGITATTTTAESKEQKVEEVFTPVSPKHPIQIGTSAKKHFLDLKKESTIPKSALKLLEYVKANAAHFSEFDDHWTLQLGDQWTKRTGGGFDLKPWSILISSDNWQVFHYGPTGIERD